MIGWIFIGKPVCDVLHGKVEGKKQTNKNKPGQVLPPGLIETCGNWFGLRRTQVPLLLLTAQVYDNPNELRFSARTLKTLIGTKSHRLWGSGWSELREGLRVAHSPSNHRFPSVLKSWITGGPPTHSSLSHLLYDPLIFSLSFFSFFFSVLFSRSFFVLHFHLLLTWWIQATPQNRCQPETMCDWTFPAMLGQFFFFHPFVRVI